MKHPYIDIFLVTTELTEAATVAYCSPPGPSIHGIFQARVLEWVDIAFSELSYLKKTRLHKAIHTSILLAIWKQQTSEKNPWI